MRSLLVPAGLVAALVLGGCGSDDTSVPAASAAPRKPADCNHVSLRGKDAAAAVGFHWTGEKHAFGTPVTIWFCVDPRLGGSATIEPPEGVTASPSSQPNSASGTGVLPFTITV